MSMKFSSLFFAMLFINSPAIGSCPSLEGETIRFVVPNSAGGGYDRYSRLLAPFFGKSLQTTIKVQNIDEAGGAVGAATIRDAVADGRTLGILNGPGLMIANLVGQEQVPNPAAEFTLLARIARSQHVWVTAAKSPLRTMDDVFDLAKDRPLVYATRDVASISFLSLTMGAHILGIPVEAVAGYSGSSQETLALLRGEVDVISVNFSSAFKKIEAGDLRPLLQITEAPIPDKGLLDGVPTIGGEDGLAGKLFPGDSDVARRLTALANFTGAGRLIAAPLNLNEGLRECMQTTLLGVLADPEFVAAAHAARLSLSVAPGDEATLELHRVAAESDAFRSIVARAVERLRQ